MAVIKEGFFSGPSGKIGNLVAARWRGINYLRTRPENYTDANTPLQQATRMKMKLIIDFLKACIPVIRIGFLGHSTPTRAAFHAATSYNYRNGLMGEFPNLAVDYANVMVSRGTLPIADTASCESVEAGKISFTWSTASGIKEAGADDAAILLAYNPSRNYAAYSLQGYIRQAGEAAFTVPSLFSGENVHCYLCFANLAQLTGNSSVEYISDSMYLGKVTV